VEEKDRATDPLIHIVHLAYTAVEPLRREREEAAIRCEGWDVAQRGCSRESCSASRPYDAETRLVTKVKLRILTHERATRSAPRLLHVASAQR
jgi:hypothetical protein